MKTLSGALLGLAMLTADLSAVAKAADQLALRQANHCS